MDALKEVQTVVGGRLSVSPRGLAVLTVYNGEKSFNVYQKPNGLQILMPNGERKPFKTAKLCSDWMKVIGAKE